MQDGNAQDREATAQSLLDHGILEHVLPLLQSRDRRVREAAGTAVRLLAGPAGSAAAPQTPAPPPTVAPPPPPPRARRTCAAEGCTATRGLRRCGGCRAVKYCSLECAQRSWTAHRPECRRLKAEREAAAPTGSQA